MTWYKMQGDLAYLHQEDTVCLDKVLEEIEDFRKGFTWLLGFKGQLWKFNSNCLACEYFRNIKRVRKIKFTIQNG